MKIKMKYILISFTISVFLLGILCVFAGCSNDSEVQKLLEMIEQEDVDGVKKLLESGVDPNKTDITPGAFWTLLEVTPRRPLAIASRTGNMEIVKLLIEHGATAEAVEGTGFSPLREALFYYQPDDGELVALLLENGADILQEEEQIVFIAAQMTPRVYDKTKENGTVFSSDYDEETAKGITEIVCMLLGENSVDMTTRSGETLLMVSASAGNLYLAQYLISEGCDCSVTDTSGKTALDYARQSENEKMIALLQNAS